MVYGCSESVTLEVLDETEDPIYRRAKDLLARDLNSEALSNFNKLIAKRDGIAPESHLEAGLIHLNHIKDNRKKNNSTLIPRRFSHFEELSNR